MRALLLLSALALAGCQSPAERRAAETGEIDVRNGSMQQVSGLLKAARTKFDMQPGKWDIAMQVVSADLSAFAGPEREAQMEAVKRQERHGVKCQTAADLKPLDVDNLEKVAGTCTFPRYIQRGGKIDVEIHCAQPNGPQSVVLANGTMTRTAFDVTIDQKSGDKGQPGYAAFRLRATGKRLGLCQG
jgi:hypothetical protein